jgi:hypothetical protein
LTNLLIHNYYYRGKSQKKLVKTLIESNDITNAKIKLDVSVIEHNGYINSKNIVNDGNNFTSVDNLSLNHAKRHVDSYINNNSEQQQQKDASIRALLEEEEQEETPITGL